MDDFVSPLVLDGIALKPMRMLILNNQGLLLKGSGPGFFIEDLYDPLLRNLQTSEVEVGHQVSAEDYLNIELGQFWSSDKFHSSDL